MLEDTTQVSEVYSIGKVIIGNCEKRTDRGQGIFYAKFQLKYGSE